MSQSYVVQCPHCRANVPVDHWRSEESCPSCGKIIDQVDTAAFRPAEGSATAKVVAVAILIVLAAMLLIAVAAIWL